MIARSKTNLFLAVTQKRSDGFHELDIMFNPLENPHDIIDLEDDPLNDISFSCTDKSLETPDNLCVKAAKLYFDTTKLEAGKDRTGLKISLVKNIPVAAGLGGGSSDAATLLLMLNKKYGALDDVAIKKIALELGSDVPFFLDPVPSSATGRGEKLIPLEGSFKKLPLLLFAPLFPVPASWAYSKLDYNKIAGDKRTLKDAADAMRSYDLEKLAVSMRNDLEYAVMNKFPILEIIANHLKNSGALRVMVSGSGPTLVALFPSFEKRAEAIEASSKINLIVP